MIKKVRMGDNGKTKQNGGKGDPPCGSGQGRKVRERAVRCWFSIWSESGTEEGTMGEIVVFLLAHMYWVLAHTIATIEPNVSNTGRKLLQIKTWRIWEGQRGQDRNGACGPWRVLVMHVKMIKKGKTE